MILHKYDSRYYNAQMVVIATIMFVGGLIMAVSKDAKLSLVIVATMPVLIR